MLRFVPSRRPRPVPAAALAAFAVLLVACLAGRALAATVVAPLEPPPARTEPGPGSPVLDRALRGEVASGEHSLSLPLASAQGRVVRARAEPGTATTLRLPWPARVETTTAPAAQAPAWLQGQLPGLSNPAPARPEMTRLARDWSGQGAARSVDSGVFDSGGGAPSARGPGPLAATPEPLVWLAQGLAYVRENRMQVLAVAGALLLLVALQQVMARHRS